MNSLGVKLAPIEQAKYSAYKKEVIFSCNKWDPQIGDINSISDHVVLLSSQTAKNLSLWAEALYSETLLCEKKLLRRPDLWKTIGLPRKLCKALLKTEGQQPSNAIALMRFDFHPIASDQWALSEVNRDVPGGFAEASTLPIIACQYFKARVPFEKNVIQVLSDQIEKLVSKGNMVAFVLCTSYTDDMQVMKSIAQNLKIKGLPCIFIAPDHIRWQKAGPISIAEGQEGLIGAIVRFYPAEWMPVLSSDSGWHNFFSHTVPAANHASAVITQSKRLPLIWEQLDIEMPIWKQFLPETKEAAVALKDKNKEWVLKPAFGRVGEGITVPNTMTAKELSNIRWNARLFSREWLSQRLFIAKELLNSRNEAQYLCIGVFVVNGKACGYYGRISDKPRINLYAQDIPVLIQGDKNE